MDDYLDAEAAARLIDKAARPNNRDWWVRCPAHEDIRPSLCVSDDGEKTLFYCAAGCTQRQILEVLRSKRKIEPRRFFRRAKDGSERSFTSAGFHSSSSSRRDEKPAKPKSSPDIYMGASASLRPPANHEINHPDDLRHVASWNWHDAHGRLLAVTARFEDRNGHKDVLPFTPWTEAERPSQIIWKAKAPPLDSLWYDQHLDDGVSPILAVEGEKCVEASKRLITGPSPFFFNEMPWITTVLGGARKLGRMNLSKLAGRHLIIMQDMDKAGLQFAGSFLHSDAASITLIRIPRLRVEWKDVPTGYDNADMETDGFTFRDLEKAGESKIITLTLR